ncbi:MAG: transporter substrate-binding domain-containing protein [Burkholderiales bacterium]|nr:transporter substrate-binding domain-containing protein [Burkholderiales bacterium]
MDFRKLAVLALLFVLGGLVQARELRAIFNTDKPPFSFRDERGVNTGIEVDLMRTLLARMGHTLTVRTVPNNRLLVELITGQADIAVTVSGSDDEQLFFSDDFITFVNVAISKKSRNVSMRGIADLGNYTFVIWQRGWRDLGPEFESIYKPDASNRFRSNYYEVDSQEVQSRMFWLNRTDLIVVDKTIFQWYQRILANTLKIDEEVVYHDIFHSRTGFPVAFRDRKLRDRFNQELRKIRADGTYQKILDKYK